MALLVPNVGEVEMLKRIVGEATGDVTLHLYSNAITPAEADVVGTYTEVSGNGYAAVTLNGTWTFTDGIVDTNEASYPEEEIVFSVGTGATVEGYFITDSGGTILLWAEKFSDGPYTIPTGGGSIFITPKIQLA